ncbi:membrane protein insertase YidC [Leeia sp. TBRC 13508]|uniref:Membrane protein insertase YidC n=1 Tax=Leeia speluncae TaxID=2884804 RepID=A0ABS8D4R7_9NEIS|nr:membrane protein insertase YidC [Leeia speluncae]MCB6182966.1 membrane protein insertase YidC [Leeia speluncae]
MEFKRLILFIAISIATLFLWQEYQVKTNPALFAEQPASAEKTSSAPATSSAPVVQPEATTLENGSRIKVKTDLISAEIDTVGGDIRHLELFKHLADNGSKQPFVLMQSTKEATYVAQSGFTNAGFPNHKTHFTAAATNYALAEGQDKLVVKLDAPAENGITVSKLMTFHRGNYAIDVTYQIKNDSGKPITPNAYYRILRDGADPASNMMFSSAFHGAAVYTEQKKYQKVSFSDIDKNKENFVTRCSTGWVGMVQHYFISVWLPPAAKDAASDDCAKNADRTFELKKQSNGLYSMGTIVNLPAVAAGKTQDYTVQLYSGPEDSAAMDKVSPSLTLTKDYGIFRIFADPLFWLLVKLHALVGNWGWAIILLTVLIKAVFYYPSAASYRSMAKMRDIAPRLQSIREKFGDDRQKQHQAMMELYKTEKINPLGGCLPMLIQIPVFMGLYWCLLGAVELRHAPWMFWIQDLSHADPYYILPLIMAVSMWYQTTLNPPPADPMQAKMMKIMPLMFSVFFFFSPSGLVLYWLVNNILSIIQQKVIYKTMGSKK